MSIQKSLAINSIQFYQNHISPRKGYSCAYGVLYNDLSCSSFCLKEIQSYGVIKGIRNTIERLKECKTASSRLKEKRIALKSKVGNSAKENSGECKKLDTCDKLLFAELVGEAACCILSS